MCYYQPNALGCTCAFFQLIQPCSSAKSYDPPDPSRNPNRLIVVCGERYFAQGVGVRICVPCQSRFTGILAPMGMRVSPPSLGWMDEEERQRERERDMIPRTGLVAGPGVARWREPLGLRRLVPSSVPKRSDGQVDLSASVLPESGFMTAVEGAAETSVGDKTKTSAGIEAEALVGVADDNGSVNVEEKQKKAGKGVGDVPQIEQANLLMVNNEDNEKATDRDGTTGRDEPKGRLINALE